MMTSNNAAVTVAYNVITINREKEIVRTVPVSTWREALDAVAAMRDKAINNNWTTFEGENRYSYPHYVARKNPAKFGGSFITSFSAINGKKEEGGLYYFTYIKKAA